MKKQPYQKLTDAITEQDRIKEASDMQDQLIEKIAAVITPMMEKVAHQAAQKAINTMLIKMGNAEGTVDEAAVRAEEDASTDPTRDYQTIYQAMEQAMNDGRSDLVVELVRSGLNQNPELAKSYADIALSLIEQDSEMDKAASDTLKSAISSFIQ